MPPRMKFTPGDRDVLRRIPPVWCDEIYTTLAISKLLDMTAAETKRRIWRLWAYGLVRRRFDERGLVMAEIRRRTK